MIHLAAMAESTDYYQKFRSKRAYDFKKSWFEREVKGGCYYKEDLTKWKIPEMPYSAIEEREEERSRYADFMEMGNIFRRWNGLSKTNPWEVNSFLREVNTAEQRFQKYRTERKLDLRGPKYFLVYDTRAYARAPMRPLPTPNYYAHIA